MKLATPKTCLVRDVSTRFSDCLRTQKVDIDLETARMQHSVYCQLLDRLVGKVVVVPQSDDHPDCSYIEDTAVVINRHAVITRPGAPSRRGEVEAVADVLSGWCRIHRMKSPALMDGGDVMRVGETLIVGISERTNKEGVAFLQNIASMEGVRVLPVPLRKGLHLKSACTMIDDRTAIYNPEMIDPKSMQPLNVTWLPAPEPVGANVLALGPDVVVSQDAQKTVGMLKARGYCIHPVSVTEFHKGDGALTCLSIRIPAEKSWCC